MKKNLRAATVLIGSLASLCAVATAMAAEKRGDQLVAQADDSRCRKQVNDYVQAMHFVRQAAGAQIGDRVASNYVSEGSLEKVAAAQGPCAAAQLLHDKGATR